VSGRTTRKIGLARALSKLGYSSRSRATDLVRAGRVTLNGKFRRDPETPVSMGHDEIAVDGNAVEQQEKIYLMLNKPRGVVTTASDEKGRETVYDLLQAKCSGGKSNLANRQWLAPVGRLDKASEGLLLLTNDTVWATRVSAPETHLDKTYHVQISRELNQEVLNTLARGIPIGGDVLRVKQVSLLRAGEKTCWLEIVLDEGKNRQIRRMMEAMNIEVLRLIRVAIGPLPLGDLAKGESRPLNRDEKRMLDRAMRSKTS